jgi:hypothetical protein
MNKMWDYIKNVFKLVGAIYTFINVASLLGIIFLPFNLTTSNTLRGVIAGPSIIGGVLGYFLTASSCAGKKKKKLLQQLKIYLAILWFPLLIFVGTLVVIRPEVAKMYPFVRTIREFLIIAMPLLNFIVGVAVGFASYLLIGAITLSSCIFHRKSTTNP